MKIKIFGAHGLESTETKFMSLLIDEVLALDAGALAAGLSFSDQEKIKAVLLSHSHADHAMGLASFAMRTFVDGSTVEVYALKETGDALTTHVFNGVIDPEFTRKPATEKPALRFHVLETYKPQVIAGYTVLAFPVHHSVPAVGYQVTSAEGKSVLYSGDTGPGLPSHWEYLHPDLLIFDCAGSNRWSARAPGLGHMTPELLKPELIEFRQRKGYLPPVILVHMFPLWENEITEEVVELAGELDAEISLGYEGMKVEV
ncbi:MAG: MBL fold metallo-hydrolase [Dehalococcoidia bacterium]|nr:MBL fold metallo-hydrolase [Dehalococcoidia bacterium]